jgi:catechol 2,3-dioxygenase-like lactoylglutathione lyase family enzyme
MGNALVPEFGVTDWAVSRAFYCDILGFEIQYERPEQGFSYLALGDAELMIDQVGIGRTYEGGHRPTTRPFGRGLNVQIQVSQIAPLIKALSDAGVSLFLPQEDAWYRADDIEWGNRQFVVADPDGYLLRFFESLGSRPV